MSAHPLKYCRWLKVWLYMDKVFQFVKQKSFHCLDYLVTSEELCCMRAYYIIMSVLCINSSSVCVFVCMCVRVCVCVHVYVMLFASAYK